MDVQAALAVEPDSADPATLRAALLAIQGGLHQREQQQAQALACMRCDELAAAQQCGADAAASGMFGVEQLAAMLRRENELRLSPETQAEYTAAELREDTDWMEVSGALQRRVLAEAGVPPAQMGQALRHFRAGPHRHPELKPLAVYHRHQRSRQGDLGEGDPVPATIQLLQLEPQPGAAPNGGGAAAGAAAAPRCRAVPLLGLASGPRPLALLAGSWGLVGAFNSLFAELRERVDVRGVYITEAHAQDEWPISSARFTPDRRPVVLNQPRSSEERAAAAARFVAQYHFEPPMLVDPLECACAEGPASQQAACQQAPAASACASSEGPFEAAFAPWPIRFYVLWRGRVAYKAQPRDCSYDLSELRARLLQLLAEASAGRFAAAATPAGGQQAQQA